MAEQDLNQPKDNKSEEDRNRQAAGEQTESTRERGTQGGSAQGERGGTQDTQTRQL